MSQLTCPVCDRPGIESDICPNCETNLSTLRLLAELPIVAPKPTVSATLKIWFYATIVAIFLLGISLATTGGSLLSPQLSQSQISSSMAIATNTRSVNPNQRESIAVASAPCLRDFYYRVSTGDSLAKIARQFYGDSRQSQQIVESNSQLNGREHDLDLDEKLLMPKLYRACN